MAPPVLDDWVVVRVNHCALVNDYYDGQFAVRRDSLQIPERSFVGGSSPGGTRSRRKRKRSHGPTVEQLIACGKFVPLDDRVVMMLRGVHESIVRDFNAREFLPVGSTGDAGTADMTKTMQTINLAADHELHRNDCRHAQLAKVAALEESSSAFDTVLLPPRTAFASRDVRHLDLKGMELLHKFKLIVMDPPWENKSVGRARRYTTFDHRELLHVDVPGLADTDECVLGIWVTNKPVYSTFLLEHALPAWRFTYHDTWFWLKICSNGELVMPLDSTHRLPVEKLVVAYRGVDEDARKRLAARLGSKTRVVVSIPLRHSWKPPPESLFDCSVAPPSDEKLELFARELRPGWTSIGLEVLHIVKLIAFDSLLMSCHAVQVLKFQTRVLFDTTKPEESSVLETKEEETAD